MKKYSILAFGLWAFMLLTGCSENTQFESPLPSDGNTSWGEGAIYEKSNKEAKHILLTDAAELQLMMPIDGAFPENTVFPLKSVSELQKIVDNYNDFKATGKEYAKDYQLLPEDQYDFSGFTLHSGHSEAEATLTVKAFNDDMPYGDYILPICMEIEGKSYLYMVFVRKDGLFSPIAPEDQKPLPPGGYSCPDRTEPLKMIAYVETNNYDIRNYGQVILEESKKPVFDMVILFAANMNYDAAKKKRVLFFNDKLEPIVKNPEKYIKPLTDRGIKVLIDILPNHQGVGYANFQSYDEALEFAGELKVWTDKLGIDGWDIDEEYAKYAVRPELPFVGAQSFLWYMRALKEVMPDKMLTLYDFGHGLRGTVEDEWGKKAKDYVDYSWANYNEWHGSYIGLPKERYGMLSIEGNQDRQLYYARNCAEMNLNECYGSLMFFNVNPRGFAAGENSQILSNLSRATQLFYGENCVFSGKYHVGPQ